MEEPLWKREIRNCILRFMDLYGLCILIEQNVTWYKVDQSFWTRKTEKERRSFKS